jgi:AcrR family transcriptional regulator
VARRKDAARNRAAILTAARELFACGRDVPTYEIGRRAGVGQATLYRHFPERSTLVAAITDEHIERIERVAAEHSGDDGVVFVVLDAATEMLMCTHDLIGMLREDATLAPVLNDLRRRMLAVLADALNRSRASDRIRDDVQPDDLILALKMINGALVGVPTAREREIEARRALAIAVSGLTQMPAVRRNSPAG